MRLSDAGLAALKSHEGLRLEAYPDPGSKDGKPVTIGYGSTRRADGGEWQLGGRITEPEAAELLRRDVAGTEAAVSRLVRVPLTQAQFDALVSFVYNVGAGSFESSTLLRLLNAGDYAGAAAQFGRWVYNDGRVLPGLQRRRAAEAALFASGAAPVAGEAAAQAPQSASEAINPVPMQEIAPAPDFVPEQPPAPIVESQPTWERPTMAPFIAPAFSLLVQAIPELIRSFGSGGEVTERNAKAAEAVLQVAQTVTGAPNIQAAAEAVMSDPAARGAVTQALAAQHWFEATEAGGGGIAGARDLVSLVADIPPSKLPAMWITLAILPLVYAVVGAVLFLPGFSDEMKGTVIGVVLTGALGAIVAFWLGSSFGSSEKSRLMAGGR